MNDGGEQLDFAHLKCDDCYDLCQSMLRKKSDNFGCEYENGVYVKKCHSFLRKCPELGKRVR